VRRRIKEQLRRMGGVEYARVNLSFIDKQTRQESFVSCKELGSTQLIPNNPLPPGDVFTVGHDAAEGRYSLFRIQCSVAAGSGRYSVVGVTSKGIRESGRMAYDYLRATGKKIGLDRDLGEYDVNVQVMSLTQGKDAADLGMAFYIALLSATLGRPIGAQLVVLGQMSLHGVLSRVEGLGDKLRMAMDAGAIRVLIPTENSRDFAVLPGEVLDKLRIEFYSEPSQAAFKAFAE
jgi:ATP-dependent Lon protease